MCVRTKWKRPEREGGDTGQEWETHTQSGADLSTWVDSLNNCCLRICGEIFTNMAAVWRFALFLCMFLMVSRSPSLASDDTEHGTTTSSDHGNTSSSDSGSGHDSGHDTSGDTGHGDSGHGGGPITTLPIVSWKWHHVETPYLVALWILVSWLCKISESKQALSLEGWSVHRYS